MTIMLTSLRRIGAKTNASARLRKWAMIESCRWTSSSSTEPWLQSQEKLLSEKVFEQDKDVYSILQGEIARQKKSINLIPSENFTSRAVMDMLGSPMQNKYSEGYPGARYYGGTEWIDKMELLCQRRALDAFNLTDDKWNVNVQALSGSPANLYIYYALLKPHDRIMGLDVSSGGHLSHGYGVRSKSISATSAYFTSLPYRLDPQTQLINYDELHKLATYYNPKIIIAGTSSYSRLIDYKRFREIADEVGAYLVADMSHISGLVAAGQLPSPFEYSDLVMSTTHKSLRGPRGAMIFFRKGLRSVDKKGNSIFYDLEDAINFSVFPGHQGGPHNHTISALAVALKQAKLPEFVNYQKQVISNAKALCETLKNKGFDIVSGGTDNHLMVVDMRPRKTDGARVEKILGEALIAANKNTILGDKSAMRPSGIRLGTPPMTSRGLLEKDFVQIAEYFDRAVDIARSVSAQTPSRKFKDFVHAVDEKNIARDDIDKLREEVGAFAEKFFYPTPAEVSQTKVAV